MAASWNILIMITLGTDDIFDSEHDFPTMIRMSIAQSKFAKFYLEFFKLYSWTDIAVVYDQGAVFCPRWRKALEPVLATNGMSPTVFKMRSIATGLFEYEEVLKEAMKVSRVFAICSYMRYFRSLMIAAHRLGMTGGDYLFLICTRYNGDFFGNYSWYRGDEYDEIAKEAWDSVLMVKLRKEINPQFSVFEQNLRDRAWAEFNYTFKPEPGPADIAYYDLFLIYGQVLNESFAEGGNHSDGVYMKSKIKGRTFEGISGKITFDSIGAKEPDFSLYDINPSTGEFQMVADYFGATQYLFLNNVSIHWPNDRGPPPNTPICGFLNDIPACAKKELNVLAIVSGSILGLLVLVLFIVLFGYRRMKIEAELNSQWWRIKSGEVAFQANHGSIGSRRSRLSLLRSTEDLNSFKEGAFGNEDCGVYQGRIVFLQKTILVHMNLTRKNLIELKQIDDLPCSNLIKFIGLYHFDKSIYKITDYSSRGSLQDIVQNDSINLDWDFKAALLTDLTNGMSFLHNSLILLHGRLNSDRCVIDSRFVLKITGFGLIFIHGDDPLHSIKKDQEYLWFAPEVLRGKCKVSQPADIYSFSMIMFEILTRMAPFEMDQDLLTAKQISCKIKDGGIQQPFRPQLPSDVDRSTVVKLMMECWEENPFKRPTFRMIKKQLKNITGISNSHNILDSLIRRMEQYANNLEDLVGERTEAFLEEKKKSEQLLDQVLPRSVATKLKNGQPVDPEAFQSVTIYFSDIVGFTNISAESSAIEVVDLLNDLYTMFDAIIDKFQVYKVETIGDAYMVVSGLPVRNGNEHAKEIAQMSLAILRDIRDFKIRHLPNITLQARIGLHSGPVCAGVVGKKMPRYCLFGDTVNTASRMESHGQAMRIHVSPHVKLLLDTFGIFTLQPRGEILIKGKGEMTTYWLIEDSTTITLDNC